MVLIGLWHGITWNFAIWGLWHGIGLFVHNRWLNYIRTRTDSPFFTWVPERIRNALGVALTFQFTTLGWVWFALPGLELSLNTLRVLAGLQVVR
jgi:alginate O-acetyltransferase complex protein AlgI